MSTKSSFDINFDKGIRKAAEDFGPMTSDNWDELAKAVKRSRKAKTHLTVQDWYHIARGIKQRDENNK